jgi:hypothetical protein
MRGSYVGGVSLIDEVMSAVRVPASPDRGFLLPHPYRGYWGRFFTQRKAENLAQ